MKKLVSYLLYGFLLLGSFLPVAAQKVRPVPPPIKVKPVFARFDRVRALTEGSGVLIQWQMVTETDNAGFYVYRMDRGERVRVNDSLELGSGARLRGRPLNGESYSIYDAAGGLGSMYVVESLGLNGRKVTSQPIVAGYTYSLAKESELPLDYLNVKIHKPTGKIERSQPSLTKDLTQRVQSSQATPNLTNQRWVVSQPGAKISVRKDGFYRVTREQLQSAGFDVNTNSDNWQLFMEGNEQAIIVGPSDAYIEFLGKGRDTPESDTRVYYLVNGPTAGKRIASRILPRVGPGIAGISYPQTFVQKDRRSFVNTGSVNPDGGHYFGTVFGNNGTLKNFNLSSIDLASQSAVFSLRFEGDSLFDTQPPHSIDIVLNGHELGIITGGGNALMSGQFTIPTGYLVEGANSLEMTTASTDFVYFDQVSVSYNRRYVADQDTLSAFTQNYHDSNLEGFDSPNIRVFDTTCDGAPVLINGLMIQQDNGKYTVVMPSSRAMVLYAVEDSAILAPSSITANTPSTLSTPSHQADLVIISYSDPGFMSAANAWADFRRTQGVAVEVVDIADVYDEFSYGSLSSAAVNGFLQYAYTNWQTKPRYVLLIGDGSFDPRNFDGAGYWDLIPTVFISTTFGWYESDEALGDFNNDGLSELRIGRVPARTAADVTNALAKVQAYSAPVQPFDGGVLLVYDQTGIYDFQSMTNSLANEMPAGAVKTYVDTSPANKPALLSAFNSGKYVVNYSGHASAGVWGSPNFFGVSDGAQLTNTRQSIVTMLSCLNGEFTRPTFDSLSESMFKNANGGAVATWASSGDTTPDYQMIMATRFYDDLTAGTIPRLGDLVFDAKSVLPPQTDVGYTWILLGDPMLQVR